jgi:hypothetical protein
VAQEQPLGIGAVWQCRNVRIDGLLDLDDRRRVGLEIKYRTSWEKACQACGQFGWYQTHIEAKEKPLSSGLVVFETFTCDCARRKPNWLLESGWTFSTWTTTRWKDFGSTSSGSAIRRESPSTPRLAAGAAQGVVLPSV